ncbi:hypothetical protein JOF56_007220 [Kibdelosporangium banguiense]|uniref:Uncharacterized protein n=1 Tax=Kibdelosporangium banguiense TaxID=1365924 RepID=A0ABS4TR03_9PSEU|nr:hypothetical protein [Kibdelosporangium banguiense]MBP2326835.1 hypothetical protein [Kibdelosporangium banguiense]
MAITAGMSLLAALAAVPSAAAEPADDSVGILTATPNCTFSNSTWVVAGNWDGIGGDGIGIVVRDTVNNTLWWYLRDAANSGPADYIFSYGEANDWPVTGDWDGVGGDGPGIVRPIQVFEDGAWRWNWQWHLRKANNSGNGDYIFTYGRTSYRPFTGDWLGVGRDGPGVAGGNASGYKAWHLRDTPSAGPANHDFTYGLTGDDPFQDAPIAGNWDAAGGDSPGVVRKLSNTTFDWHLRNTLTAGGADYLFNYGLDNDRGDCLVVGNWDGIGGDGIGIVRFNPNGNGKLQWHLRNAANSTGGPDTIFDYS